MRVNPIGGITTIANRSVSILSPIEATTRWAVFQVGRARMVGQQTIQFMFPDNEITQVVIERLKNLYKNIEISKVEDNIRVDISFEDKD